MAHIGKKVERQELRDLHFMRSVIESETRHGQPFGKLYFRDAKS
jgi:hypothetical protein